MLLAAKAEHNAEEHQQPRQQHVTAAYGGKKSVDSGRQHPSGAFWGYTPKPSGCIMATDPHHHDTQPLLHRVAEALCPCMQSIRDYTWDHCKSDMAAALTVAVVALPQSMAAAIIAGVHPRFGLYAAIVPVIIAALWGSSRYLVAGPTIPIAMLLFSTLSETVVNGMPLIAMPEETRLAYIFGVSILAGVLQVLMGLARTGELVHFISHSVMVGFSAGAAVLIAVGQVKFLLGLAMPPIASFPAMVLETMRRLPEASLPSLAIGLGAMLLTLLMGRLSRRIPAALVAVVLSGCVMALFDLERYGIRTVGHIPRSLPPLSLPPVPDMDAIRALFMPSLAIALLGVVEALSIAKSLAGARGERLDGNQEFIAQGLANIAAGFTSGIPGSGSFTRSAANFIAGAKTRFASAFSALVVLAAVLVFAPFTRYLPTPALAGILMLIAWGIIDRKGIMLALRATRGDRYVLLTTFAATLLLDLEKAVFVGVLLSIALFLRKVSHPRVLRLDPETSPELRNLPVGPCCPNISCYAIEGTLFFGAVDELEEKLYAYEDFGHRAVVLHLGKVQWIDATGIHAFEKFLAKCRRRGVTMLLSGANEAVTRVLTQSGMLHELGETQLVPSISDAYAYCYANALRHEICARCQNMRGACLRTQHAKGKRNSDEAQATDALPGCTAGVCEAATGADPPRQPDDATPPRGGTSGTGTQVP